MTDANLFLGRLLPEYFPKIFGPTEDQPLSRDMSRKLFEDLTADINAQQDTESKKFTPEEVALGFLKVADESVSRPIRNITEGKGYALDSHHLAVFGGAGNESQWSNDLAITNISCRRPTRV